MLKQIIILFLLVSVALCFGGENKKPAQYELSLSEAIQLAFKNNKDIQIQVKEVEVAGANILGAKSETLPKLNASAGYIHTDSVLGLGQIPNSDKDTGIFTGYENENRTGVSLDKSLYAGGAITANLKQAQIRLKIQEQTLRLKKGDLKFEIKRFYYGLLLSRETQRIVESLLEQAKSHYEEVNKKYKQGQCSRYQVLQSKVQVSKLSPQVIKAKNIVRINEAELKKVLALKLQDEIILKDKLVYAQREIKEDEFIKFAGINKPEMILQSLGIDMNKQAVALAKAGNRPKVNANFAYNYRSDDVDDILNDRHSNWNAGVSVIIPVFDGFAAKAKIAEAKARYSQAVLAKENLSDTVAVEIRRACLDLKEAEAIINSQKDNIDVAKEALKMAEVSYNNGEGTNLDVLDSQVSLSQVEKNLCEAIFDYLMAGAYLDRIMGKESEGVEENMKRTEKIK